MCQMDWNVLKIDTDRLNFFEMNLNDWYKFKGFKCFEMDWHGLKWIIIDVKDKVEDFVEELVFHIKLHP